jgi:hypothetical protein
MDCDEYLCEATCEKNKATIENGERKEKKRSKGIYRLTGKVTVGLLRYKKVTCKGAPNG